MGFAVECFNILAWPLFSLGYPLCASIRAIETNSDSDVQKLVTYWVCFSIVSLFDHAFGNLLQWFPLWNYVKLLAICWLVMPHFDGSLYVYKHFIHPCFLVTPEFVINRFKRWKEYLLPKERFLVAAEKYIEENGAEALENLIAKKSQLPSKFTKPNLYIEEVKAVASKEKNVESSKFAKPNLDVIEVKAVAVATDKHVESFAKPNFDVKEVKAVATAEKNVELLMKPNCGTEDVKAVIDSETSRATEQEVNDVDTTLSPKEIKTSSRGEKEMVTGSEHRGKETSDSICSEVQKEWTCALCQVTTQSETTLKDHILGKRHKTNLQGLKEYIRKANSKAASSSATAAKKVDQNNEISYCKQANMKKTHVVDNQGSAMQCNLCEVWCSGSIAMISHLKGKKHLEKIREMAGLLGPCTSETPQLS